MFQMFSVQPKNPVSLSLLVLAVCSIFPSLSHAEDLRLDHRRYTDRSGARYFVVLAARGGSATGHAFVVWGKQDPRQQLSSQAAFGFYPAQSNRFGVFGAVPGAIRNEALKPTSSLITDRVIIEVNRDWYEASQTEMAKWATSDYRLFSRNCISFVRAVAQRTNTKLPAWSKTDFPSSHIKKIIVKNRR